MVGLSHPAKQLMVQMPNFVLLPLHSFNEWMAFFRVRLGQSRPISTADESYHITANVGHKQYKLQTLQGLQPTALLQECNVMVPLRLPHHYTTLLHCILLYSYLLHCILVYGMKWYGRTQYTPNTPSGIRMNFMLRIVQTMSESSTGGTATGSAPSLSWIAFCHTDMHECVYACERAQCSVFAMIQLRMLPIIFWHINFLACKL